MHTLSGLNANKKAMIMNIFSRIVLQKYQVDSAQKTKSNSSFVHEDVIKNIEHGREASGELSWGNQLACNYRLSKFESATLW
jgi:hypothetical protein